MTTCTHESNDVAFLSKLFGDSAHTAILQVLLDADELSSRELVARTGYERDLLQIAVAKLESEGVVQARRSERTTCWRLDPESPLVRSLTNLRSVYNTREFYR